MFRFAFLFLSLSLVLPVASALADTDIANGRLYFCRNTDVLSARDETPVTAQAAKRRFRRIIAAQQEIIADAPVGSAERRRAVRERNNARQGLADVDACVAGELDGPQARLIGNWNLLLEDGQTPAENGYNSLTVSFTATEFVSEFDGNALDCHWEGTYNSLSEGAAILQLTTVGTGGLACESAIGQSKSADVEFSEDGNTLTLDYTPEGTLQVYQRVE